MRTSAEILNHYLPLVSDSESEDYIKVHSKRFAYLIQFILASCKTRTGKGMKIIDIGPSFFTDILSKNLPEAEIHTMGFAHPESRGGHFPEFIEISEEHFTRFDLNLTEDESSWVKPDQMDLVVMGEVLEHLHTSPIHVFSFVKSFLKPDGKFIVGTPNAVALEKRIALFLGKNPYELIRLDKHNPGHFREYTIDELREMGQEAGLRLVEHETKNYFSRFTGKGKAFDAFTDILPFSFRTGINCVFTPA